MWSVVLECGATLSKLALGISEISMRIAVVALFLCSSALQAQYSPVAVYSQIPNFYAATMANMTPLWHQQHVVSLYKGVRTGQSAQSNRSGQTTGGASSGTRAPLRQPGDFTFPYQRRLVSVDEMAGHLTESPNERRLVAAELAQLIETVAEDLKQGDTPYDVSKAFTFFTATMYSILHPEVAIDQGVMDRLRFQFRSELLDPASLKASPADRTQRQWETLIGIGGLVLMGHERALQQGDQAVLRSLRSSAALGLTQLFRVDSSRLKLDPRSDLPLSLTGEPDSAVLAATSATVPAQAPNRAVSAPATPAVVSAHRIDPNATVLRLGHYHMINGVHPAELRLHPEGLSFDPLGQTCNQAALKAPYADVIINSVAVNGNGETLLNLRIRDPRNPKKTLNFNFATEDARNDNSSGIPMVRSPDGALDRLRQVAEMLRARGAR